MDLAASKAPETWRDASSSSSRSCSREGGLYAHSEIGENMGEDGSDGLKRVDVRALDARKSVRSKNELRLDPRESCLDPRESVREKGESRRLRFGVSSQAGQESDPVDAVLEKRESRRLCGGWSPLVKQGDSNSVAGCYVPGSDAQRVKSGMVASSAMQSPS